MRQEEQLLPAASSTTHDVATKMRASDVGENVGSASGKGNNVIERGAHGVGIGSLGVYLTSADPAPPPIPFVHLVMGEVFGVDALF